MKNDLIKSYVGQLCEVIIGQASFTENITGKIMQVTKHWIEVENKKGKVLLNIDFVNSIKLKK